MNNPRKRPLPSSSGSSNKYGSRRNKLSKARPPQPASVARLESLLNGSLSKQSNNAKTGKNLSNKTCKKFKDGNDSDNGKRKQTRTSSGNIDFNSNDDKNKSVRSENKKRNRNNKNGTFKIENTTNDELLSRNDIDRWSYVKVNVPSKDHRRPQQHRYISDIDGTNNTSSGKSCDGDKSNDINKNRSDNRNRCHVLSSSVNDDNYCSSSSTSTSLWATKKNRIERKKNRKRKKTTKTFVVERCGECSVDERSVKKVPSTKTTTSRTGLLTVSSKIKNEINLQSISPENAETLLSTEVVPVPAAAVWIGDAVTTPFSASSMANEASTTLSNSSSFRPKLGLRLSNKTTKTKCSSSRRTMTSFSVPSSSLSNTPAVAADVLISIEERQELVLSSPRKFTGSSSSSQNDTLNQNNLPTIKTTTTTVAIDDITDPIQRQRSDEKKITTIDSIIPVTTARLNNRTNTTNKKRKGKGNDNFVRLNLKNNAGACRGAKNKSNKFNKERRSWSFRSERDQQDGSYDNNIGDDSNYHGITTASKLSFDPPAPSKYSHSSTINRSNNDNDGRGNGSSRRSGISNRSIGVTSYVSKMSGLDPLDEFVDGTFLPKKTKLHTGSKNGPRATATITANSTAAMSTEGTFNAAPKCARHQRPCKLIKVKKNTTGNKGRMFYACQMPRGEQCDHFQWADDTIEAAREILSKNSSYSGFITRQVAAHVDRFRTLTVPELKDETVRRGLNKNGKKQQLLMRLAIWTRDELVKGSPEICKEIEGDEHDNTKLVDVTSSIGDHKVQMNYNDRNNINVLSTSEVEDSDNNSSSTSEESSDDELELFDGDKESEVEHLEEDVDDNEAVGYKRNEVKSFNRQQTGQGNSLSESLQHIFGHACFRNGQEWAIQRCLEQKRSLLVAPTGFGKSLCYALPAALMDGVCVVVSPLISLIQDQLRSLPPRIPAATLSGSVSASKTAAILDDIVRKRLKILFVSPERLTSPAFRRLFNPTWNPDTKTKERKFPEISLLCIDEAHCISQWAHNFRPCFLRFKGFLKIMKPKSVLAITATAGPRVITDIGETLGIELSSESISTNDSKKKLIEKEHESIKVIRTGRDNIDVMCKFMSNHEERLAVLSGILTPNATKKHDTEKRPYAGRLSKGSVIVYVWRQRDTEVVAENLVAAGVSGGVVVYHGGMDANARAKSQSRFMRGKARIIVATVAFGLGIDKADIIGVIHLYLSNSPEHYLQEIGRAGRDGRRATAIALPLLEEVPVRHSLVHSNLVAKSQIRSLFQTIRRLVKSMGDAFDLRNSNSGRILHIALPVHSTVRGCDCKPETIETFLSLIERIGGDYPILQIEGYNYDGATIALKRRTLQKLAEKEPVAIAIQAVSQCIDAPLSETGAETMQVQTKTVPSSFQRQFLAYSKGSHSFSISQAANRLGPSAEPRHVFAALRRLQSSNELEFVLDTSEKGRIFHLKISEKGVDVFNRNDYDKIEEDLVSTIFESFTSSGNSGATKVLDIHYILDQLANSSELAMDANYDGDDDNSCSKSPSLMRFQELTHTYFKEGLESERLSVASELLPKSFFKIREKELKIDGLSLLRDLPSLFLNHNDAIENSSLEQVVLGDPSLTDYSALAITKFLHGHDTPRTPIFTFRQYPSFGKWKTVDFHLVHEEILKLFRS